MIKKNFVLISNQRCGSTWFITSIGNCINVETDYEIKWSKDLLVGKASPYHLFLEKNNLINIFDKFNCIDEKKILGTKFVFDFYRSFPIKNYKNFLNKFKDHKVIHLKRDYLNILKSKLIGKVTHLLDKNYAEKKRLIDNTILNKQKDYLNIQKNSKESKNIISFDIANSYLLNLFINDILTLSLKKKNNFLGIKYEEIKMNMPAISNFLNLPLGDLKKNFFKKPVIIKNKIEYIENFEKLKDLQKINMNLKNKIDLLSNINFNIDEIICYDSVTKKLRINI